MNRQDFIYGLVERRIRKIRESLDCKGKEYAGEGDMLVNFKRGAAMDGTSPEETLWGYLKKHLVSILDMIQGIDQGTSTPTQAWIDEKLGDCQNYFILLEGLLTERMKCRPADPFATVGGKLTTSPGQGDPGDEDKPKGFEKLAGEFYDPRNYE